MKAWVLHDTGNIRYEEVPVPEPAAGEVLICVGAAGICGSDVPRVFDTGAHNMPLIIGHEFSGRVEKLGDGVDSSWRNKRVGVFPLIPCRKCEQCINNRYELCRDYDYLGSRRNGGFAGYVAVPQENLIELPDTVTFEEAAMLEPMAVAVHAIRRAMDIDASDRNTRIAVYGLGTIGMFIVMFLVAAGYNNLYLFGNKDSQRKKIISMGMSGDIYFDNSVSTDYEKVRNRQGKADIVFECVGRTRTYADAIDIAAPMGKVILVGNPYSDMTLPRDTYWKILRNQLTVTGTWNSSFTGSPDDDWHYVLDRLEAKSIDPAQFISHRMPLKDLKTGLDIMHDKTQDYGKIMILRDDTK